MNLLPYFRNNSHKIVIFVLLPIIAITVVLVSDVREFLNMNRGSISALLTMFLVYLYFVQYQTQRNQQELLKATSDPNVVIEGFRGGMEDISQGNLEIALSNIGNGVAKNLVLVTDLQVDHAQVLGHTVETNLTKSTEDSKNWFRGDTNYINPDIIFESYNASFGLRWKNIPKNTVTTGAISSLVESLEELDIKTFRVQVLLRYFTPDERTETQEIIDLIVPVEEDIRDVNGILHRGLEYELYMNEIQHPGNPFEKFGYVESPVGLASFETEVGPPDEIEIPSSEELIEILADLAEGEYIFARQDNNTVSPIVVTAVNEDGKSGKPIVSGRKEVGEKNPVSIKSEDGEYFLFEDSPYLEGWEKKRRIIDIDRKYE